MRLLRLVLVAGLLGLAAPAAAMGAPPVGVTGLAKDSAVELAWQPVTGATEYKVYRGTSATTVTTPLMLSVLTPPSLSAPTSFTDITAVNGTTYFYAVRAIENGVESGNSRLVKATPRARSCSTGNVVVLENCYPGNDTWHAAGTSSLDGFATEQSIDQGGSLDIKARSNGTYDIEIYRTGYYGGDGARLVSTIVGLPQTTQPSCTTQSATGLIDCSNWSVSQTITTTASWPSGVYVARLVRQNNTRDNQVLFVVRDDDRGARILFGIPFTTYQAYNKWGGKSLYDFNSSGADTVTGTPRAAKVSFDRPYFGPNATDERDFYTRADFPTVTWLERSGYDVSYDSGGDLERAPARIRSHRVYISGAHDEYYSAAMRTGLEQARDAGVNLFFTGANEVFWKIRFEPSPVSGRADRVLVCYKSSESGPADPSGIPTGTWRDPEGANKPENALSGIMYVGQAPSNYFPLRVTAAQGRDRIWRYTGLDTQTSGSMNVGTDLVGWEWDARVDNGREPPGVVTLSGSPVSGDLLVDAGATYRSGSATSHMAKYTAPSGALVVATGTNHWPWGLAFNVEDDGEPNAKIQQATTNILADMSALPETPASGIRVDDPTAPPGIPQRTPAAGATNVSVGTAVRATFSREMDASTITPTTFTLTRPDGGSVPASVSYNATTFVATLTPLAPLSTTTQYTARLAGTIRAANGIPLGAESSWSFTTSAPDTAAPSVQITAPTAGASLSGTVTVTASATDNVGVAGVQFKLDGDNLGSEDTEAPFSVEWDTSTAAAGAHQLTAVARDGAGNSATSASVGVTSDPRALVAAYGFDEPSGTTVTDSSGKGNTGTVSGAARTTGGRYGGALSFDGVNDWVTVPDSTSLDLTTGITLSAWVRPAALGSAWRTVLMKEQSDNITYALYGHTNTNQPSFHVWTDQELQLRGGSALALNTWTHLAATYEGSVMRLYVNGTQAASVEVTGRITASNGVLRIGGNSIWDEWFSGLIDEVRVYGRALSAAEIQADRDTPVAPTDTSAPTAPANLAATAGLDENRLTWTAATDNVGVVQYNVHRGTGAGFTPSAANRIAQVTSGTAYTDAGLAPGDYHYRVTAQDAAGNVGAASNEARGTVLGDTAAPSAPGNLTATGALGEARLNWNAATDNVGVAHYNVHRGTSAGFAPSSANRVAQPTGTSYTDRPATPGTYYYRVTAEDGRGNVGPASNEANANVLADTTAPTVSLTAPSAGATVHGDITVAASASDDVGVAGVRFRLDGENLGTEDPSSPYSITWDTRSAVNGAHELTAIARDAAGNERTAAAVTVNVSNSPTPEGLVAAYGFEETAGSSVVDSSSSGNTGTISGATRSTSGRFGRALSFDGANDWVTVADANSLDVTDGVTIEAWVRPTTTGTTWRTVAIKEQTGNLVYALYANTNTRQPSAHVFTTAEMQLRGTSEVPTGAWTHLAMTYDGSMIRLYSGGLLVASVEVTGPIITSTGPLRIGGTALWAEWFHGLIDEVRVYNRALSAAEITADSTRAVVP